MRKWIIGSRIKVNHNLKVDKNLEKEVLDFGYVRKKAIIGVTSNFEEGA